MSNLTPYTHTRVVASRSDNPNDICYITSSEYSNGSTPWTIILILLAAGVALLGYVIEQITVLINLIESHPVGSAVLILLIGAALSLLVSVFRGN